MEMPVALTFDDVLLMPGRSDVVPGETNLSTFLSRNIPLNIPLVSSAMDTVTESSLAIAIAREGGLGFIHRNLSIEDQRLEVDKVKRSESGMIVNPITMRPDHLIRDVFEVMERHRISGVPIVEKDGKLVGIVTNRDLRFEPNMDQAVSELMTAGNLITVKESINLEEAKRKLHEHRIEKLLVVDKSYKLRGMITVKDIMKTIAYPNACKDTLGRLRVGAAVGATGDFHERALELESVGVDVIAIDTAHGHTTRVVNAIRALKKTLKSADVVAGNIASSEAAKELHDAGADAIKIGMGPGSICTTRVVSGAGVPQITAIMNVFEVTRELDLPVIAGASSVMIGNLFAGTDESPGELILYQNRSYKSYRGMGSLGAMAKGSRDRYGQEDSSEEKLVPEGIEGRVPYKGGLSTLIHTLLGGIRAGMGYCGVHTISELQNNTRFIRITNLGLRESHVHDVAVTKEAPNYRVETL